MLTSRPTAWDRVADVVILGSGAAGLTAATLATTVAPRCCWSRRPI